MNAIRAALAALLLAAGPGLSGQANDPQKSVREALQAEVEDFSVPGWEALPPAEGPAVDQYRARLAKVAGLKAPLPRHRMGTLPLVRPGHETLRLGVNVFQPEGEARGTLLFVHGYLSHAANFAYTFAFFVARGWTVITLDLPGHGFSTGDRGDVDSFEEYGDAVAAWLTWCETQWPGPKLLMAHSLGTAATLEALRRPETPRPARLIFCAPLLRPDWYPALSFGETSMGWFLKRVPSSFGWDGYLDGYDMPVHWFAELNQWLEKLKRQGPLDLPLTIYSGNADTVVDEGWNRSEYRRLVPGAKYVLLPGATHLFLTTRGERKAFHARLAADLDLPPIPLPPQD